MASTPRRRLLWALAVLGAATALAVFVVGRLKRHLTEGAGPGKTVADPVATLHAVGGGRTRPPRPATGRFLGRAVLAGLVVAGVVGGSDLAWGMFSQSPTSEANSFAAGVLSPPGLSSIHPTVTGTSDGNVQLTWTDTISVDRAITYTVLRSASSPVSYTTVATGSSTSWCTPTTGATTCNYTDTTASYDSQYLYEVRSSVGSWNATSNGDAALSLAPTSATDTTAGLGLDLHAVDAITSTNLWAVGADCAMVVSTTGTSWSMVGLSSAVCPAGTTLTGIDVIDATDGWAVGTGGLILVCTLNCTSSTAVWTKLVTEPTTADLHAVTAVKNGPATYDVWAVGSNGTVVYCSAATCSTAASSFTAVTPAALSGDTLNGVDTVDGNEAWLVGSSGSHGIIAQCASTANCDSASGWTSVASPSSPMNAVYGQATNFVYVVGNGGTVEVCTAGCQNASPVFAAVAGTGVGSTDLAGVYMKDGGHAWVVGAGGFVDYCSAKCNQTSGGTWTVASVGTTQNLLAVAGIDPTHEWAVGVDGTIVSDVNDGTAFAVQPSGLTSYALQSTDLTRLSAPDGSSYALQAAWTASTLPTTCSYTQGLEATFSPLIPPGSTLTKVAATVVFTNTAKPTGAADQLLVSGDGGSTWSAFPLTAPAAGTSSTQSVTVTSAVSTTSELSSMAVCFEAAGASSYSTSVDLLHVDVDASTAGALVFTSADSTAFAVGSAGSFSMTASGTPAPTITESGTLPTGVSFTSGTGSATLSGTPASGTGGTYVVTLNASNAQGTFSESFTLNVDFAPSITSAASATFVVGSPGTFTVATTGLPSAGLSQSTGSGQTGLPSWASFTDNANGTATLSGTPPTGSAGTYSFTITATNSMGSASQTFTLTAKTFTFAGLAFTSITQSGGSLSCSNPDTATVSCSAQPLGGTGTFSAEVELVDGSGTPVTNIASPITVSATEVTVSNPGGSVSPSSLQIATGSAATSGTFTLTGLGGGWKATMTCTVVYNGTTYTISVTGN